LEAPPSAPVTASRAIIMNRELAFEAAKMVIAKTVMKSVEERRAERQESTEAKKLKIPLTDIADAEEPDGEVVETTSSFRGRSNVVNSTTGAYASGHIVKLIDEHQKEIKKAAELKEIRKNEREDVRAGQRVEVMRLVETLKKAIETKSVDTINSEFDKLKAPELKAIAKHQLLDLPDTKKSACLKAVKEHFLKNISPVDDA
jgi:hypothetical protein